MSEIKNTLLCEGVPRSLKYKIISLKERWVLGSMSMSLFFIIIVQQIQAHRTILLRKILH